MSPAHIIYIEKNNEIKMYEMENEDIIFGEILTF